MQYLKMRFGFVPHRYLAELVALDDMMHDVKRMDTDIKKQTDDFKKNMKKQGEDFNRLGTN